MLIINAKNIIHMHLKEIDLKQNLGNEIKEFLL